MVWIVLLIVLPANKVIIGMGGYRNHPVYPPRKCKSSWTDDPIPMTLHTVVVYDLRMCIKGDNSGPKNIKGLAGYLWWFDS